MKIIITESQYKSLLSEQTSTSDGCKVWVESKNDPKYIKYTNALNLYMRGKSIVDFFRSNPDATNDILNKKEDELVKKYPVNNRYLGFGSDRILSINSIMVGKGRAARYAQQYPKPDKVCVRPTPTTTTTTTTAPPPPNTNASIQKANSLFQRYNYMSTEDKKRAVAKYGDPSKVPFQGVDVLLLRKQYPNI